MEQDRNDWRDSDARQRERAEFYKAKCYELMKEVKEVAFLVSSDDSLESMTDRHATSIPPRQSKTMPTSQRISRKRKNKPPTQSTS